MDLASLNSIKGAADEVASRTPRLDLLINNAGLMATDLSRTEDRFERQIGVNHLGHFALKMHLLPLLFNAQGSRIVTMSSIGHRRGKMDLAELNPRLVASGGSSQSLAAHPGVAKTALGSEGSSLTNRVLSSNTPFGSQSAAAGALSALRAATDSDAKGGEFYGPRWFLRGYPIEETPNKGRVTRPAPRLFGDFLNL